MLYLTVTDLPNRKITLRLMIENIPNINFPMNSKSDKNARKRANSIEKPEKRPRGNSIDVSHVHSLTLGAEIVIRATESVVQVLYKYDNIILYYMTHF